MKDLVSTAVARLVVYGLPWALGLIFAWAASQGWGVYNEITGTLTITFSIVQIVSVVGVFLAAPALAIAALLGGWKSRFGDRPVSK